MLENALWIFGICLLVGSSVGFLAVLLGIGWGLVIVPALAWLLPHAGISSNLDMHIALGTSLASTGYHYSIDATPYTELEKVKLAKLKVGMFILATNETTLI